MGILVQAQLYTFNYKKSLIPTSKIAKDHQLGAKQYKLQSKNCEDQNKSIFNLQQTKSFQNIWKTWIIKTVWSEEGIKKLWHILLIFPVLGNVPYVASRSWFLPWTIGSKFRFTIDKKKKTFLQRPSRKSGFPRLFLIQSLMQSNRIMKHWYSSGTNILLLLAKAEKARTTRRRREIISELSRFSECPVGWSVQSDMWMVWKRTIYKYALVWVATL